ncbi:MAG: hypothetical protein ACP5UB_02165 [Candidatus Sumerlaeaceae bacterium]|jgi:hypothetical protein
MSVRLPYKFSIVSLVSKLRFTVVLVLGLGVASRNAVGQEMAILAAALDVCALDTGYYVALEALDDTSDPLSYPSYNYIDDQGGSYVIRPWEGRFSSSLVKLADAAFAWRGPYVTYQPSRTQQTAGPYDRGSPLDPWGNPYYFFSPLGLLRGDTGSVTLELYGDQFDRYTFVSLGPDGVQSNDDLIYQFGPGLTVHAISSLRGSHVIPLTAGSYMQFLGKDESITQYRVASGSLLTVRGINLFDAQGHATVWWGSVELSDVVTTSAREITVRVPDSLQGTNLLRVRTPGGGETNSIRTDFVIFTPACDWMLYD